MIPADATGAKDGLTRGSRRRIWCMSSLVVIRRPAVSANDFGLSGEPRMVGPISHARVPQHPPRLTVRVLLTAIALGLVSGCVERRYTLRTDPPGALAIVNGEEIGTTPVSRSYTFYGDRKISFLLDGYENKTVIQPMNAPWYDNLFTEFFTENLIPYNFRDEREFTYKLGPYKEPTVESLQERAEELRAVGKVPPAPRRGGFFGWLGF